MSGTQKVLFNRCPLCGHDRYTSEHDLKELRVFRCEDCGMMFLNPYTPPSEMAAFYESRESMAAANPRLESYYDRLAGSKTERFFDYCVDRMSFWRGERNASVLDIGCGNAHFLSRAKLKGWEVAGIEPSAECCREAGTRFGIDVAEIGFEAYEAERLFDCLSLWDVIEHVPVPLGVLKKAGNFLKPGGILLMATPNHDSFINFVAGVIERLSFGKITAPLHSLFVEEHILYFTAKTARRALEKCGFEILEEIHAGTDIGRYNTGVLYSLTARTLLLLSRWLGWENRVTFIAKKQREAEG